MFSEHKHMIILVNIKRQIYWIKYFNIAKYNFSVWNRSEFISLISMLILSWIFNWQLNLLVKLINWLSTSKFGNYFLGTVNRVWVYSHIIIQIFKAILNTTLQAGVANYRKKRFRQLLSIIPLFKLVFNSKHLTA